MGTATPNVNHNTNYSLNSFGARGGKVELGLWTPTTLGVYTTVGEPNPFTLSTKPIMVIIGAAMGASALTTVGGGVDYRWDYTNQSIRAFISSTLNGLGGTEATTTYAAAVTTALPYIAFSW